MMRIHKSWINRGATIHQQLAEVGVTNIFLLLVLVIITFYPLLWVGFTTLDDAMIAILYGEGGFWDVARKYSESQGRFSHYWGHPLSRAPYAVDSRTWYLAIKYGIFLFVLGSLYYAVSQIFKSFWIALATLVFFLSFIQNGWDHNALTSYPFIFNFLVALFLVSLGLFSKAIRSENLSLAVIAGGLYFFALASELFVLFFPFYVFVLLSQTEPGVSALRKIISKKKYLLAILLPLIAYLVIYLVWRRLHPSIYDGNNLNAFNLAAAARVVTTYSLSAFPFASLTFIFSPDPRLLFVNSTGLNAALLDLNVAHFIKPLVVGFLFFRLMTKTYVVAPRTGVLLFGSALALVGIFLPNLLLAFTEKHQGWVASGTLSYLYTYYSFISASVFLALIFAYVNFKSRAWHPNLRLAFYMIVIAVTMSLSFAVEVRNQYIAFDQKLSHRKWQLMDAVIKSPTFAAIPDESTIVAPTLTARIRGIVVAPSDYWTKAIHFKTGKNIQFVDDRCIENRPCYSIVFRQEEHSDNQFVILSKIGDADLQVSSDLTIYSMANQSSAVLTGSILPGKASPSLLINGIALPKGNIGSEFFSSKIPYVLGGGAIQTSAITGNVNIFPDQVSMSRYSNVPRYNFDYVGEPILFTSSGNGHLYQLSGWSFAEPWGTWSDGDVALLLLTVPSSPKYDLELSIKGQAFLAAEHQSQQFDITINNHYINTLTYDQLDNSTVRRVRIPHQLTFEDNGRLLIKFYFKKPKSPADLGLALDRRRLGLGLQSLELKLIE